MVDRINVRVEKMDVLDWTKSSVRHNIRYWVIISITLGGRGRCAWFWLSQISLGCLILTYGDIVGLCHWGSVAVTPFEVFLICTHVLVWVTIDVPPTSRLLVLWCKWWVWFSVLRCWINSICVAYVWHFFYQIQFFIFCPLCFLPYCFGMRPHLGSPTCIM